MIDLIAKAISEDIKFNNGRIVEAAQGDEIGYYVEYNDGTALGHRDYVPATEWYAGASFDTAEEANRWAAEKSKGKLWRLIKADLTGDSEEFRSPWVTPEQAEYWKKQQTNLWAAGPTEVSEAKSDGWIGVDLDGTLATHDKFKGVDHIGKPVPKMVERVKRWLKAGKKVKIFTARVSPKQKDCKKAKKHIQDFCKENFGKVLEITYKKDPHMISLYDDRARQVKKNTGEIAKF